MPDLEIRGRLYVRKNECLFCSSLKAESPGGFGGCPFYGGVSTVVYSLFAVAPIGVWSLFDFAVLCILSSRWGGESWLLYFYCVLNVMPLLSFVDSSSRCHGLVCSM